MKKVIAVLLAALMLMSVLPFAVFAADEETAAEATVAGWDANYELLIKKLLDSSSYAHYQYVVDNEEEIQDTMAVYTAFGLYDNAWANYATKEINTDTCKKILLSMIEEYKADFGEDYTEEIVKVLETASDAADFVEKLNGYVNKYSDVLSFVESDTWSTTFQVVDYAIQAGNAWIEIRAALVKAYSEILSVQMANGYYLDMLAYIAANTEYEPMAMAAEELIEEATTAINDQLAFIANEALKTQAAKATSMLINLAANTNVYTAAALKIYNISTSIADKLWNTSDQYALYDQLVASYYAEEVITDYTAASFDAEAEKEIFAVNALISVRDFGEGALYALTEAKSGGVIGKIKSKLYNTVCSEYTANIAELALMEDAFFGDAADIKVAAIEKFYCPVNVIAYNAEGPAFNAEDGAESVKYRSSGYAKVAYNAYNNEYVKVLFVTEDIVKTVAIGTADGYVTYMKYVLEDGEVADYSFTEIQVAKGDKITVEGLTYTAAGETNDLNDVFVLPEGKTVTAQDVIDAAVEVGKDEANSFAAKIKAFFQKIIDALKNIFKFGK